MTAPTRDATVDDPSSDPHASSRETPERGDDRRRRTASAAFGGTLLMLGLKRRSLGGAAMAVAGSWLLYRGVSGRGRERRGTGEPADAPVVERSITVGKPADELYEFWREPENLARIVGHFAEVTPTDEDRQRWEVDAPLGRTVAWDAEVVEERPGESLRWESVDGTMLSNGGSVRFRPAPGDRGTEVTLRFRFDPPGGALGDAAVKRLGFVPGTLAGKSLRRFKSLVETGEIPTLDRNPSARGSGDIV